MHDIPFAVTEPTSAVRTHHRGCHVQPPGARIALRQRQDKLRRTGGGSRGVCVPGGGPSGVTRVNLFWNPTNGAQELSGGHWHAEMGSTQTEVATVVLPLDLLTDCMTLASAQVDDLVALFHSDAYGASAQNSLGHPGLLKVLFDLLVCSSAYSDKQRCYSTVTSWRWCRFLSKNERGSRHFFVKGMASVAHCGKDAFHIALRFLIGWDTSVAFYRAFP